MTIYKRNPSIQSSDFSEETLQTEGWHDIVKILKEKNHQSRITYPAKLSFRYEGKIKAFPENKSLRNLPP